MTSPSRRTRIVYDQNSHTLFLLGLLDQTGGEPGVFVNSAAVTAYITDENGLEVWGTKVSPKTLATLGPSVAVTLTIEDREFVFTDGNYSAVIEESVVWTPDPSGGFLTHTVIMDADAGLNIDGHWESTIYIQKRRL